MRCERLTLSCRQLLKPGPALSTFVLPSESAQDIDPPHDLESQRLGESLKLGEGRGRPLNSGRSVHVLKLVDAHRAFGEAGSDLKLPAHRFDEFAQSAHVHVGAAFEL